MVVMAVVIAVIGGLVVSDRSGVARDVAIVLIVAHRVVANLRRHSGRPAGALHSPA